MDQAVDQLDGRKAAGHRLLPRSEGTGVVERHPNLAHVLAAYFTPS